ncbi:hypothetical protein BJY16_007197 [Actinoplanes octamycinicus]|uniref:Uncharacterized protein n=1 Tax=Actinoplanes octamycinicus TaxID=135948 RepID=A0A7W7H4G1_9ACTN|nr:hypothetical protein [Actinoplanes octamycinicus]MBB4743738.1 hypothetical protein [Actinoplanes octamycinicus]GIE61168.1 hypothetical protein Aoc01nite_65700 [Actinoplanes octamycinicus]
MRPIPAQRSYDASGYLHISHAFLTATSNVCGKGELDVAFTLAGARYLVEAKSPPGPR